MKKVKEILENKKFTCPHCGEFTAQFYFDPEERLWMWSCYTCGTVDRRRNLQGIVRENLSTQQILTK